MKSPFPGMDPYIEAGDLWEDFHNHLIERIYEAISAALPRGYAARTGKRSYVVLIEKGSKKRRPFVPDVKVTSRRGAKPSPASSGRSAVADSAAEVKPVSLRAFVSREFEEKFIDIYELQPERRLVTSVEVLSPSNKRSRTAGWKQYVRKRQAFLLGKANLVEIDLLRNGDRMRMLDPWPASPYTILVAREDDAPRCDVWPAFFDRPLSAIPVPLNEPDSDIPVALQPLVDAVYERGRYDEAIDYSRPLTPPLTNEEAAWLKKRLRPEGDPSPSRRRRK